MTDMFLDDYPFEWIDKIFSTMALTPQHIHMVLTKRPERMREYFARPDSTDERLEHVWFQEGQIWPLPNVWLGVSVENQQYADERIPLLLQTPAAVRFVSYEPALGPVDFAKPIVRQFVAANASIKPVLGDTDEIFPLRGERIHGRVGYQYPKLDWIIVGGESGPSSRPFNIQWARDVVEQCQAAGVPVFVKQLGANPFLKFERTVHEETPRMKLHIQQLEVDTTIRLKDRKGGSMEEWPSDLRVREFPTSRSGL